jgi:hypothetical protein
MSNIFGYIIKQSYITSALVPELFLHVRLIFALRVFKWLMLKVAKRSCLVSKATRFLFLDMYFVSKY